MDDLLLVQVVALRNFQIFHLPRLLAQMNWRVQRELRITYVRKTARRPSFSTDIQGSFSTSGALQFFPIGPIRVLDTR